MRRQARISTGGALVVRSASALQVWLWLLIFVFQNVRISGSIHPGYLDFDNLPDTNFTCAGKVIGGYYADLETSCQMFHVCTVGQQDEPMDIKFLCLNGTVFDQETRVCERVDEVDCTKSEKFYNLNLELYGSTLAPPVVQSEETVTKSQTTEHSKPSPNNHETDPSLEDIPSTTRDKEPSSEVIDFTEDPVINTRKEEKPNSGYSHNSPLSHQGEPIEDNQEEEEIDSELPEYEDDYDTQRHPTTTTLQTPRTTTTTKSPPTSTSQQKIHQKPSSSLHLVSSPTPVTSLSSHTSSAPVVTSLDPSLLSPQEFIYRHRGPGSEAISFQRQSFRPADGVYITHAPPPQHQQYDHFPYESSRTAPRPVPFVQRPQPFRPTTVDPRDQLLRPGPNSQSSERYETSIKHHPQHYPPQLSAQRPVPFDPYYFDHKRSDDTIRENQSSLAARSVAPLSVTERPPTKPKSPPRVIVTASASVSDSNGKKLNYTVGNVVNAVKPIVPINYDDYKESDLIFDPFFLDVPKLQKRRRTRSSKNKRVITVPDKETVSKIISPKTTNKHTTLSSVMSQATTTIAPTVETIIYTTTTTTTAAWNPDDYVDDNYEPHAYNMPPVPPLASLVPHNGTNYMKSDRHSTNDLIINKKEHNQIIKLRVVEQPRPTSSATAQSFSSQSVGAAAPALLAASPAASPPPAASLPPMSVDARFNQHTHP